MKPEDLAAYEKWRRIGGYIRPPSCDAENAWEAALAHRDKQAAQAVPVVFNNDSAWDLAQKVRADLDRKSCPGAFMDLAVESINRHYTEAPAVAQPPAEVVRELVEALKNSRSEIWRLLDGKGIDPKDASRWPEIVWADAALAKVKDHGL